jgi:hypothetical protein
LVQAMIKRAFNARASHPAPFVLSLSKDHAQR